MASIFQIDISQNTKYALKDGFLQMQSNFMHICMHAFMYVLMYVNNHNIFQKIDNLVVEAENTATVPTQSSSKHVGTYVYICIHVCLFIQFHCAYIASYCIHKDVRAYISDQICKTLLPFTTQPIF